MDYGAMIKDLREAQKLSQRELAAIIGVTDQAVSNWERGVHVPRLTLDQAARLCDALRVEIDFFRNGGDRTHD